MVMKFPDEHGVGTAGPYFLHDTSHVGFSDLPVDPGGTTRRGLLFLWDADVAHVSFSLQLALRHLQDDGIGLAPDPSDPNVVRIGNTSVPPFHGSDGGYVHADDGGYQFLLDYADGPDAFPAWTLGDLFAGRVPEAALRDHIAILGTTSPSVKDEFYTPWNRERDEEHAMSGLEVHAHSLSQLLRFARGQSAPITSASEGAEAAWILLFAGLGALLGSWNRSALAATGMALAGLGLLVLRGVGRAVARLVDPRGPAGARADRHGGHRDAVHRGDRAHRTPRGDPAVLALPASQDRGGDLAAAGSIHAGRRTSPDGRVRSAPCSAC